MKSYIFKTLLFGLALTGTVACSDDLNKADYDKPVEVPSVLPVVTTGDIELSGVAAKVTIDLQIPEGAEVLKEGVVYSNVDGAPIADPRVHFVDLSNVKGGKQSVGLTGLSVGETYYVRAYAYVKGQMVYGETKTFVATDDYEYATDIDVDFSNEADVAPFSVVASKNSVQQFELVPLDQILGPIKGYANTVFDHNELFGSYNPTFVSREDESVLSYELDLSDKSFPRVIIQAFNICRIFGTGYPTNPGDYDVYVSATPITSVDDLKNAEKIGSGKFSTDPTDATFTYNEISCSIPVSYSDKCYVSIYNKSVYATENGNMGVVIVGFGVESLHQKAQSAE